MGKVYARLIHDYVALGIDTSVHCIADITKAKYKQPTRDAYLELFGTEAPETDPNA